MSSITKPITTAVSHAFAPVTNAISRAFTLPGMGGTQSTAADTTPPPPPQAGPAQSPTGSSNTNDIAQAQLSFLTAASKAAAAMGGATQGKSLLGQ